MAFQYGGPAPSSGLGNLGTTPGAPGSPGAMPPRPVMQSRPLQQPPSIGNIQMAPSPQPQAPPQARAGIDQIMSRLHPQAMQALKGIPQEALKHLSAAGLIHPGVMGHLYGAKVA